MSRIATIAIDLDELPLAIRESFAAVLRAHGYRIHDADGRELDAKTLGYVMREIGNNVSQAVVFSDVECEAA